MVALLRSDSSKATMLRCRTPSPARRAALEIVARLPGAQVA